MDDPFKNYPSESYYRLLAKRVIGSRQVIHQRRDDNCSYHVKGQHYSVVLTVRVGKHRDDTHLLHYYSWLNGEYEEWLCDALKDLPAPLISEEPWCGPVFLGPRDTLYFYINGHGVTMEAWTAHENGF